MATVEVIRSPVLGSIPHGFLGRRGGVSFGLHASLNVGLGSEDERDVIAENRRRAVAAVAPEAQLVTVHQVHSATAIPVTTPFPDDARPHADALVTDQPGLALGILTADCVPVLFADPDAGIVGAAHAGWKGTLGGVVEATLVEMEQLGANRTSIAAAIGPCIGRTSYEVSDDFALNFEADDPANERFFTSGRPGHRFFDIEAYVAHRLAAAGVTRIDLAGLDTVTDPDRFFSYRRATLAGASGYGRQISLIALR